MASVSTGWFHSPLQLLLLLVILPGCVVCEDGYNIGGMVAAAAASVVLLAIIITMIIVGVTWNNWYPSIQLAKGKVKMPRAYWKKKEEAKRRLLSGSRSGLASIAAPSESGLPNGTNTASRVRDTASWVQGWNNANPTDDKPYEEMALAMDLGEEKDEEFRIETTVVDNEALDLGPFRDDEPYATSTMNQTVTATAAGGMARAMSPGTAADPGSDPTDTKEMTEEQAPEDSYIYSTVDRSKKTSNKSRDDDADPEDTSEKVTSFSKMDPYLVAL